MRHQRSYFSTLVNAGEPTLCQRVMWRGWYSPKQLVLVDLFWKSWHVLPLTVTVETSIFQLLNSSCLSKKKKNPKTQHWETIQSFFQWWLNDDVCAHGSRKKAFHHKLFYKNSLPCAPANVRLSSLFHLKIKKTQLKSESSGFFLLLY